MGRNRRLCGRRRPSGQAPASKRQPGTTHPGADTNRLGARVSARASGRLFCTLLGVGAALLALPGIAEAHKGSPNYRSTVRSIQPAVAGLHAQVLNYDDRLQLINQSGTDVQIQGYDREPYARLLANGTVEVNKRSPSYYLNEDRYAQVTVPPQASAKATPQWTIVDKTGRFEWHDHRIHYMSKGLPPQVKDKGKRTKVFDWRVPIIAGGRHASLRGDLYWQPSPGGLPRAALIALAAFVFGSIAFVETTRRRRRRHGTPRRPSEAWG
jgi:hypothetical protein